MTRICCHRPIAFCCQVCGMQLCADHVFATVKDWRQTISLEGQKNGTFGLLFLCPRHAYQRARAARINVSVGLPKKRSAEERARIRTQERKVRHAS